MKQVIVANKSLNMSPGKLAAMVAHGSISFLTHWVKDNIGYLVDGDKYYYGYTLNDEATFPGRIFDEWLNDNFTKIVLEADQNQMEEIIKRAKITGFHNGEDFFNIVDESTEFDDIPRWAVIAFKPMDSDTIDQITGDLNLYGKENSSLTGHEGRENND